MSRNLFLAGLAFMSIAAGVGLAAIQRVADQPQARVTAQFSTSAPTLLHIHVAGWVRSPGVVRLPDGSIVADAVSAAGGLLPGAATKSLNLATKVVDGDQVFVGGPESEGVGSPDDRRVPVNRASATDLERLPGVGPVLAERIVAHREENGPFEEVEDLLEVTGIGEAKLSSIRDLVRVP